eukprot:2651332-Pleurochrysis_carterae.AAC.2
MRGWSGGREENAPDTPRSQHMSEKRKLALFRTTTACEGRRAEGAEGCAARTSAMTHSLPLAKNSSTSRGVVSKLPTNCEDATATV